MIDKLPMSLDSFVVWHPDAAEFAKTWRRAHAADPINFPLRMLYNDWQVAYMGMGSP